MQVAVLGSALKCRGWKHQSPKLQAGNSCEREIDSLDPLRPSTNELSGARLLIRKAYKEGSSSQISDSKDAMGLATSNKRSARSRKGTSDGRIGTATSQHTFVIETERRRPLMINIGLSDSALEYKKAIDEVTKKREDEENRKRREKEEKEKQKMKALRHIQLTSRKAPSLLRKELSESSSPLIEKFMTRKANSGSNSVSMMSKKRKGYKAVLGFIDSFSFSSGDARSRTSA